MRAVDQATAVALEALLSEIVGLPYAVMGPVLEIEFPVATTNRDIAHGLGAIPDGYHVLLSSGGVVQAADVHVWTDRVCWFQASANYTRARIVFFTLQKGKVTRVVP